MYLYLSVCLSVCVCECVYAPMCVCMTYLTRSVKSLLLKNTYVFVLVVKFMKYKHFYENILVPVKNDYLRKYTSSLDTVSKRF